MDSGKKHFTGYFNLSKINGLASMKICIVIYVKHCIENTEFSLSFKLLCPQKYFTHKNYGNGNRDVESVFKNELNREIKRI